MRLSLALNLLLGLALAGHVLTRQTTPHREQLTVTVGTGCPTPDGMMIGTGFGLPCKEINLHTMEIVR